jgi:hypothetical protein
LGEGAAFGEGFVIPGAGPREVEIWGRAGGAVRAAAVMAEGPLGEGGGPAIALWGMAAGHRMAGGWGRSQGEGRVVGEGWALMSSGGTWRGGIFER